MKTVMLTLFALALLLGISSSASAPVVRADGSDPMPICYVDRNGKVHCLFQLADSHM